MTKRIQLSAHFTLDELTRSATAQKYGIKNEPSQIEKVSLVNLGVFLLEPLRGQLGRPVAINSGYRCPVLNAKVGGVANSQHTRGQAADINCASQSAAKETVLAVLRGRIDFDQMIVEQTGSRWWIHVSYVGPNKNRREILGLGKLIVNNKFTLL